MKMRMPSLHLLLGTGIILGLLQAIISEYRFQILNIPLTLGSAPFDVLFFFAGCVAYHNDWLDVIAAMQGVRLWVVVGVALSVWLFLGIFVSTMHKGPYHNCIRAAHHHHTASVPAAVDT